jgi:hypothetical protein
MSAPRKTAQKPASAKATRTKKATEPDGPVLGERALNRALLARQLLLERSTLSIPRALEALAGLQTQYAPSAYVALWTRLAGFERAALTGALEHKRAVQATLMRATIHIVSKEDYGIFAAAVRRTRREWWMRVAKKELGDTDPRRVVDVATRLLANGPIRAKALQRALEAEGFPRAAVNGAGMWIDLVRVPPSGTWEERRADLYALADDWIGRSDVDESDAIEHLAARYLAAFGPASADDVASFTGIPKPTLRAVLARMKLRAFRDERGGALVDVLRAPLPDPETPAPIRFLPTWDATLLVHARRSQILPERHRPRIFHTKAPHSFCTFLVDGQVAGTWRFEKDHVRLDPFEPLSKSVLRELEREAEPLAAFHR